ncbi:carbon-nitrogen hydrolase family protein [Gordonia sp. TBRC 11910]|uniref:Carbon-nitrogen hydrolase family protein n=1 Tax=Gordonia asplenii TaxID=2725283 RepID=A0A848L1I1_9ACTN|nr:carbon-nitrogen hydrolase family protein [Gordonia asplenii]NMO01508.1 carbon-nitrogen hydrolase family protein [Gordonia asplenii]
MSRQWRIALVQARPASGDDPVAELAADVGAIMTARPDTQMIVFPEIHLHGGVDAAADPTAYLEAIAEPLDGPLVRALGSVAAEHDVWLVPGSVTERDGDRIFNTAVVFDPTGEMVASYRKVFPWRPHEPWASGSSFVTFDVPDVGRMGVNICYDSWFPETTRQIAWMGAEAVLNVVKTTTPDREQELVLARANAIINQVYYLSVNAAGPLGRGQSIYAGPEGEVLAQVAHAEPETTYLTLDFDRVADVRANGTAGLNRMWEQLRPDDDPIDLPAYGGSMSEDNWHPASPATTPATTAREE